MPSRDALPLERRPADTLRSGLDGVVAGLEGDWKFLVDEWRRSDAGERLDAFLRHRLSAGARIFPPHPLRALTLTPLRSVRVVILGQDPYHGAGQADGLAFSVARAVKPPPSLRNILKEYARDLGAATTPGDTLEAWARGGVLLLNAILTVEEAQPASHARQGWESLTDRLLGAVAAVGRPVVFLLWGAHAQAKAALIESLAPGMHHVLLANHPSPLSALRPPRPFLGCGHFSQTQRLLPDFRWGEPSGRARPSGQSAPGSH